jgi:thioredoxin reductase (NADPH)
VIIAGEIWGGQLMLTTDVDNFPGFPDGVKGPDLMNLMRKQVERFGAEFVQENASKVNFTQSPKEITTSGGKTFLARTIIITTGAETKWLGVPGEEVLRGRGISSCAPCDAPFFKEKRVIVVGGGDSAMEEALVLTKYASHVTMVHRKDKFKASAAMQERVFNEVKNGKIVEQRNN